MQAKWEEEIAVRLLWLANLFRLLNTTGKTGSCSVDYFSNCTQILLNLDNCLHKEGFGSEIVCVYI